MNTTATVPGRPAYRPVYKALHRRLTVWGVDRRLFFLAMLMGAATFNLFYSFLAGVLMFGTLYGFAWWATDRDPDMLRILLSSSRARRRFDPGEARAARRRGAAMMRVGRILRDYSEAGAINSRDRALGIRGRHDVRDEERARRRGVPPPRSGRRGPDARPAASRGSPVRGRPPAAG